MKNFKKLFSIVAIVAMAATSIPTATLGAASYSDEMEGAYDYAYGIGITTQSSIDTANMFGSLIRSHMAKMMVNYAKEVLNRTPDTSLTCEFTDVANQSDELKGYITEACQLGLMGQGITAFNPNGVVTRAQFGTVLSRALYGDMYDGADPYYADHLAALQDAGIMNNISNPNAVEVRGYVMLMMQRAAGTPTPEICQTPENVLSCSLGLDTCPTECQAAQEAKAGTLTVSSDGVDYTSIPKIGAVKHASVSLNAGSDDINVYGVTMKKLGLTTTQGVQIWLEKDGVRVTTKATFSDDKAIMSFLTAMTVKAGGTEDLDLYVYINDTTAGSEYQFASTYIDSSAEMVNGTITTPTLRTVNYTLSSAVFASGSQTATTYKVDSTKLVELGTFKLTTTLTGNQTENLLVKSVMLTNGGTLSLDNVSDLAIYRDDVKVSTKATTDGRNVTFLLDDTIKYTTSTANYVVKGKITNAERLTDNLYFYLKNISNIQIVEETTQFRVTTTGITTQIGTYGINGADVKFNQPSGSLTKSVVPGTLGVVFYTGTITSLSTINLEDLTVTANAGTGLDKMVRTFYARIGNTTLSVAAPTTTGQALTFEGNITINGTVPFTIYADIKDTAPSTYVKFIGNIGLSSFKANGAGFGEYASSGEPVTSSIGTLSPITNNVVGATLSWSNTLSSTKTVQRNDRNIELANVEFSTSTDVISKVYSFKANLTGSWTSTGNFAGATVTVYDANGTALVSDTITAGATALNFVLPSVVNVSKNNPVAFKVKLDQVANSTVSGQRLQLQFNGADVNAKNFITNNAQEVTTNLTSVRLNVRDAGTVNVVSQAFTNKLVRLNGSTTIIGSLKFKPYNGDAVLKTLTLSGLDTSKVSKVVLKDSGSLVATFIKTGTVLYVDAIDQTILADTTKMYDVEATFISATTSGDLNPGTLQLVLESATFESNNGSNVSITTVPATVGGLTTLVKDIPTITAIAGIKGSNYATYKVSLRSIAGETRINKLVLSLGSNLSTPLTGVTVSISATENGSIPNSTYGTTVTGGNTVTFTGLDIAVDNTSTVDLYINVKGVTWSSTNNTPYINIGLSDLDYSDIFSDASTTSHAGMLSTYKSVMTEITDLGKNIQ